VSKADELFASLRAGDIAAAARLLEQDPRLSEARNEHGISVVLMACYTGRKDIRDLLLQNGAQLELYEAAACGDLPRAKELVEKDSSLATSHSPDGFPAVALAAVFGNLQVAKYLHSKGADLNAVATNGSGYNALTGAVTSGHTEIVKWLLENGAEPNYRYSNNYSPLLNAAANGHLEILKLLQAHGADLHAKTSDGKNALAYAEERKHAAIAEYLRAQGVS